MSNSKTVLIVGGAGYIGSHMVKMLTNDGHRVISFDNLSTGNREAARFSERLIVGDLADEALLDQIFTDYHFDLVMHFAAASLVGESMTNPAKYYRNNVSNTLHLLDAMVKHRVMHFVFSSTAAVFGEPEYTPIDEKHRKDPVNPYGASKAMVERILEDYAYAYSMNSVCLRYFNACGADVEGDLGEMHDPETHLIPLTLQVASGKRESVAIFGTDYPTPDGTCVRDYIHIVDLCDAHRSAMQKLLRKELEGAEAFNLGNGSGFSVREVMRTIQKVVASDKKEIHIVEKERRFGDPAILVADSKLGSKNLCWRPKYPRLDKIISHAWEWEKKQNSER